MRWRKSSYSKGTGDCVEVAETDASVVVRNSNHPDRSMLVVPTAAVAGFVAACRAGELDDLTI
jgi:hypothetical protein